MEQNSYQFPEKGRGYFCELEKKERKNLKCFQKIMD